MDDAASTAQPQNMDEEFLCDTDDFIAAVKAHDAIWNYKIKEHNSKPLKYHAWEKVCAAVIDNYEKKSPQDKNLILIALQKKWKVVRDGYSRFIRKVKKSKTGPIKPYTHFQQLAFLQPLMEDLHDNVSDVTFTIDNPQKPARSVPKLRKTSVRIEQLTKKIDEISHRAPSMETDRSETPAPEQAEIYDEDKMFLLSLIGDFKKIDEEYKLDAKAEIVNVIKHYRNYSKSRELYIGASQFQSSSYKAAYSAPAPPRKRARQRKTASRSSEVPARNVCIKFEPPESDGEDPSSEQSTGDSKDHIVVEHEISSHPDSRTDPLS